MTAHSGPAEEAPQTLAGLRLCIVGPHYPRVGGISTQIELLTHYLRADGVEVRPADTNVQAVRHLGPIGRLLVPLAQVVVVPWRLWRVSKGAHLIHAHLAAYWGFYLPLVVSLVVGRLRGLPVIVTCHSGHAVHFVPRHRRWVCWLLRQVDAIITLSRFTGRIYEDLGLQTVDIPNVVDLERFSSRDRSPAVDERADGPRLLWVKYFTPVGAPDHMVRVFARVHRSCSSAKLTMVGWGELLETTRAQARDLEVPIEFTGFVPFERIEQYYRRADIFVYTSRFDNQPNALLEASACGLPMVATAVGGIPCMVEDGVNAVLVPFDDEEAFAGAVTGLIRDPERARRLGRAAAENAQHYTWPAVRKQLGTLYWLVAARGRHLA